MRWRVLDWTIYDKSVIQKLDTITENEEETISEKELDKEEEDNFESFMKEFDVDGNPNS